MMDEVRHIVGDYHCEDDAKQVVDAARTLGHEDHQGDGRPELQERGRGGRGGAAGKEGITRRRRGSCNRGRDVTNGSGTKFLTKPSEL